MACPKTGNYCLDPRCTESNVCKLPDTYQDLEGKKCNPPSCCKKSREIALEIALGMLAKTASYRYDVVDLVEKARTIEAYLNEPVK